MKRNYLINVIALFISTADSLFLNLMSPYAFFSESNVSTDVFDRMQRNGSKNCCSFVLCHSVADTPVEKKKMRFMSVLQISPCT